MYMPLIPIMEAFNNLCEEKEMLNIFPGKLYVFFHGSLKACEIFLCVKIYWISFLVPIAARHFFIKKIILHHYIK